MASKKKSLKRRIKRIFKPSIGKLLCVITLAYFVFTFYSYANKVNVSYYEVEEGSLVKEHNYTGLILRDEQIINSGANGYIYYYVADGRKAAKGSPVYSIDEGGQLMDYLNSHSEELSELSSSRVADIRAEVLNYSRSFDPLDFRSLYNIKNTLDAHTAEYASMNIFSSIQDNLASAGISFRQFDADMTGIVCAYTDGYEDVDESEINAELFNTDSYNKQTIKAGDLVAEGSPAYKLIADENWKIVFQVTDDDLAEFGDDSVIKLSFSDKGFTAKCKLRIITGTDGRKFGVIDLDSYVIQFTSDRFINFEIVTNDVSGLKIPDKAVTTKDFYVIPASYLASDSNGNRGFYKAVVSGDGTATKFVMPEIFNVDDEYCYIDCDAEDSVLKPGDYVLPGPDYTGGSDLITAAAGNAAAGNAPSYDTQSQPEKGTSESAQEDTDASSDAAESSVASAADTTESDTADDDGSNTDSVNESDKAGTEESISGNEADNGSDGSEASPDRSKPDMNAASSALSASDRAASGASGSIDGNAAPGGLYQIAARMSLNGAYNVNKGYTVFKKVEILESANGYSIVKKNSSYGLQVYDHIVLDASTVHDGQLLYR